jgi:ABC-type Fe3+-hydroxamate transport system substrate-binding protein
MPVSAQPPERVVSLVPSVTGSLFDLGLGRSLVGVTDYCVYPPAQVAGLPKVGGTKNPDCDRIVALKPDLIIANQEENRPEDVRALEAAGLRVWVTFPTSVREALDLLWETIRVFRAPHLAATLSALEASVELASLAAASQPPVRAFVPIWREAGPASQPPAWWMTLNRDTYTHDVLRICGFDNVFADRRRRYPLAADLDPDRHSPEPLEAGRDTRYPRVSSAEVAQRAPDAILLPSEPYPFGPDDAAAFDALPEIPAAAAGRIYLVDGSLLTWPGTCLGRAIAELPALAQAA